MKRFVLAGLAAVVASMSAPAMAADWWWVAGDPQDERMTFVDAASLQGQGTVTLRSVSIDRAGNTQSQSHRINCDKAEDTEVTRFACATADQRRKTFAMLGSLNPLEAARAMFGASGQAMNASGPKPRARPIGDEIVATEA